MEMSPISHNQSGLRREPRRGDQVIDDDNDQDDAPSDLYGVLGYRKPVFPSISTQQWLDKRMVIERVFA